LFASTDPRASALGEMYDLREKFLRKKGVKVPDFRGQSVYRNMKRAAVNDNKEAFTNAKAKYVADGGTRRAFLSSLKRIDPIASRLNPRDEREFEREFLTDTQRKRLRTVRDYAADLRVKMLRWWNESED